MAGGGILIGFNLFQSCKPKATPLVDVSQLNFNGFNAFIKKHIDNVQTVSAFDKEGDIDTK